MRGRTRFDVGASDHNIAVTVNTTGRKRKPVVVRLCYFWNESDLDSIGVITIVAVTAIATSESVEYTKNAD
jgi:hypothetical protein